MHYTVKMFFTIYHTVAEKDELVQLKYNYFCAHENRLLKIEKNRRVIT